MLGVNIEPYFSIKRRVLIYFKFWESIVHLIFVSNFGCQYRTVCLNQTSGANIDAAAASLYFGWHIEILSQHCIIIVDNDLPEYLWTFQSQGSAGIALAKRIVVVVVVVVRRPRLAFRWFPHQFVPILPDLSLFFSLARTPPTLGIERFKGILENHCPLW